MRIKLDIGKWTWEMFMGWPSDSSEVESNDQPQLAYGSTGPYQEVVAPSADYIGDQFGLRGPSSMGYGTGFSDRPSSG